MYSVRVRVSCRVRVSSRVRVRVRVRARLRVRVRIPGYGWVGTRLTCVCQHRSRP